jgi:hypothetical protein
MNLFLRTYLVFMLLVLSPYIKAGPFSIADQSGYQGEPVTLTLFDDLTDNLEAATLRISYDPLKLKFNYDLWNAMYPNSDLLVVGEATSGFDAPSATEPNNGMFDVSLVTSHNSVDKKGSLLSVTFKILSNAGLGLTEVSIECLNFDFSLPCLAPTSTERFNDYYVPNTVGKVTILEKTLTVPEPNIMMLMLIGGMGLSGLSRYKNRFNASVFE